MAAGRLLDSVSVRSSEGTELGILQVPVNHIALFCQLCCQLLLVIVKKSGVGYNYERNRYTKGV